MSFKSICKLFYDRCQLIPNKKAIGTFSNEQIQFIDFATYFENVQSISFALKKHGVTKNDKVAILSNTRSEWHLFDLGILSAGGVVVPIYPTFSEFEVSHILEHSDTKVLIIEDSNQARKIVKHLEHFPSLTTIISLEQLPANYLELLSKDFELINYSNVLLEGRKEVEQNSTSFEDLIKEIKSTDLASLIYTSGTTGIPKGAMITHEAFSKMIENLKSFFFGMINNSDRSLVWLPLSHVFGRCDSFMPLIFGSTMVFAESKEKLLDNVKIAKPTVMCAVPRIFEKIYEHIIEMVLDAGLFKKPLFDWAMKVSNEYFAKLDNDISPTPSELFQRKLAYQLVFHKIYQLFGGSIRYFVSGGAPLSTHIIKFLRNCNLTLLEGYGLTETTGPIFVNPPSKQVLGTVGIPIGDVEIKFAEDHEILIKSKSLFSGYYKEDPEKNKILNDGWLSTGDIGKLNFEGYLMITDRKKDIIITSGGKNVAPQKIENLMKSRPYIEQFLVYGDHQKYLVGLVGIKKESFKERFAEFGLDHHCTYEDLANSKQVIEIIKNEIEDINHQLAKFETIKEFHIMSEEVTVESGLLTPTLKLKKQLIIKKYQDVLDSMYKNVDKVAPSFL